MPVDLSQFAGKTYKIMNLTGRMLLTAVPDGDRVFLLNDSRGEDQLWQLVDAGSGRCSIRCVLNGKVLEVADASTFNMAPVIQGDFSRASHELWTLEKGRDDMDDVDTYQIISVNSGKCLDISLIRIFPPLVAQMEGNQSPSQQWILQPVE